MNILMFVDRFLIYSYRSQQITNLGIYQTQFIYPSNVHILSSFDQAT